MVLCLDYPIVPEKIILNIFLYIFIQGEFLFSDIFEIIDKIYVKIFELLKKKEGNQPVTPTALVFESKNLLFRISVMWSLFRRRCEFYCKPPNCTISIKHMPTSKRGRMEVLRQIDKRPPSDGTRKFVVEATDTLPCRANNCLQYT